MLETIETKTTELTDLDLAAHKYESAIAQYNASKELADEAAKALITLMPMKEEGTATEKCQYYKISATSKVNRKFDEKGIQALIDTRVIPKEFATRLVTAKMQVSIKELKWIQKNEPDLYAVIAQTCTATPGKPSVKVERL